MHPPRIPELQQLFEQYGNANTREDRLIRVKIKEILAYYDECYGEEREFADEITRRFCQLISLLETQWESQPEEEEEEEFPCAPSYAAQFMARPGGFHHGLMTFSRPAAPVQPIEEEDIPWDEEDEDEEYGVVRCPFETEEELLEAFFSHFRGTKSDLTLTDYCNRIRTFTKRYMMAIPQVQELYEEENYLEDPNPILFLYQYLDFVIAHFDTKKEDGSPDKQKLNLRSALRKLNAFKYETGLR